MSFKPAQDGFHHFDKVLVRMGNKFATGDVAGMRGIAALFVQAQAADINLVNFVFEKIQYIFDVGDEHAVHPIGVKFVFRQRGRIFQQISRVKFMVDIIVFLKNVVGGE